MVDTSILGSWNSHWIYTKKQPWPTKCGDARARTVPLGIHRKDHNLNIVVVHILLFVNMPFRSITYISYIYITITYIHLEFSILLTTKKIDDPFVVHRVPPCTFVHIMSSNNWISVAKKNGHPHHCLRQAGCHCGPCRVANGEWLHIRGTPLWIISSIKKYQGPQNMFPPTVDLNILNSDPPNEANTVRSKL